MVGVIYLLNGTCFIGNESRESLWNDGIPSDGSPVPHTNYPIQAITFSTYIFSGCNIIVAIGGMIFMTVFRKRRYIFNFVFLFQLLYIPLYRVIRLSSPNLNYMIGVGVIVLNLGVFAFVYPPLPFSVIKGYCAVSGIKVVYIYISHINNSI